jgi:enterochelin esterase-like enzyme
LPAAPAQLWIERLDNAPRGVVEQKKLRRDLQKDEHTVWVYTPPGFAITGERYPLLVLFDGEDNLNTVPVPVILDNLIAKQRIPPMVAILIEAPGFSRFADLACSAPFTELLTSGAPGHRRGKASRNRASPRALRHPGESSRQRK